MLKSLLFLLTFSAVSHAQIPDSLSYFPHAVGDVWEYYDYWNIMQTDTARVSIEFDSTGGEGNHFVIVRDSVFGEGHSLIRYYIVDSTESVYECNSDFIPYYRGPFLKLGMPQQTMWIYDSFGGEPFHYIMARIDSILIDNWFGRIDTTKITTHYLTEDSIIAGNWIVLNQFSHCRGVGLVWYIAEGVGLARFIKGARIQGRLYGTLTGITAIPPLQTKPTSFRLYQNYPNPFNPTTRISYEISASSFVRLTVYNAMGQTVSTLVSSFQPTGSYDIAWDGRNSLGIPVSSGIYFYVLDIGNGRLSKKMALIR